MALVKCIECGNIISNEAEKCPHCGISFDSCFKCPECGSFIVFGDSKCSNCGCPMVYKSNNIKHPANNKNTITGMIFILTSFILTFFAIVQITNEEYKFYKQHYLECEAGYIESKEYAEMYSYGSTFRSNYLWIAEEYENLMKKDMHVINKHRITAILLTISGIALIVIGILFIKGKAKLWH